MILGNDITKDLDIEPLGLFNIILTNAQILSVEDGHRREEVRDLLLGVLMREHTTVASMCLPHSTHNEGDILVVLPKRLRARPRALAECSPGHALSAHLGSGLRTTILITAPYEADKFCDLFARAKVLCEEVRWILFSTDFAYEYEA